MRDHAEQPATTRMRHQPRKPRARRSIGRLFVWMILGLGLLVAIAPTLVLKTQLRNQLIRWAAPDFPGRVTIGSASGHWFSSIQLRDVMVWDADDQPIGRFPRITSTKQLSSWISDQKNLGTFEVESPEIQLVLAENTSNLEQLLAPYQTASEESSANTPIGSMPVVTVNVTNGRVLVSDTEGGQDCIIEHLEFQFQTPDGPPAPISIKLQAEAEQGAHRGQISSTFQWLVPETISAKDLGDGELQLISQEFPLTALHPVLRRANIDLNITGQFTSNVDCRWRRSPTGPAIEAKGQLDVVNPVVRMPSITGSDTLQLAKLTTHLDIVSAENQFQVRTIHLESDVATLQIVANAELTDIMSGQTLVEKLFDWQSSHQYQVQGQVDVAALATQMPNTLQLKEGMAISEGTIDLNLDSRVELGSRIVRGTLQADRISAMAEGKTVTWDEPVAVQVASVSDANGIEVRKLHCTSGFLVVQGHGTLQQGQLSAQGDLRKLATQLDQFCDLGDLQMSGGMVAEAGWQQASGNQCRLQVQAIVSNFALASTDIPPIKEARLTLNTQATARINGQKIEQIDACQLRIDSGEDQLYATLIQPVSHPGMDSTWPLDCQMAGHTETWLARLRPWGITLPGWDLRAGMTASAKGLFHPKKVALTPCTVHMTQLQAQSEGWLIREPEVQLQSDLHWFAEDNQIKIPSLTFTSSAITARAQDVVLASNQQTTQAAGQIAVRGDLARLYQWQATQAPPTFMPQGNFDGQIAIATTNDQIGFDAALTIEKFACMALPATPARHAPGHLAHPSVLPTHAPQWTPVWTEPKIEIQTKGNYHVASDQLQLARLTVGSSNVSLAAQGALDQVATQPIANLNGELRYDLEALATRFREQLGPDIHITGKRTAPFQLQGPLTSKAVALADDTLGRSGLPTAQAPYPDYPDSGTAGSIQQLSANSPAASCVPPGLTGQARLGWESVEAYGVALGPQDVQIDLKQGTLLFSPIQTTLAQGNVAVKPRIDLNAQPMMLTVEPGTVAENINITPEMTASWFQYITPILAGATTAQGKMSIDLVGAQIPLTDPTAGKVVGAIRIHEARVQPGPLAQQLLGTINELSGVVQRNTPAPSFLAAGKDWLVLNPQQIDFQMADKRILHRNLELTSGNVVVRTQGSVGLNQSLDMLAEVPIQDKWLGSEKYLDALRGQTLKLPVKGTLSSPDLDRREIANLSRQLIGNTAEKLIQEELQKGLQKGLQKLLGQ